MPVCYDSTPTPLAGKLRPIAESLARMSPEDRAMYRLPEDALGAIHYRAIERIYGDSVRSKGPAGQPAGCGCGCRHVNRCSVEEARTGQGWHGDNLLLLSLITWLATS